MKKCEISRSDYNSDNRIPYTYALYHMPTGLKYYGVKWGKDANPKTFWKNYFTSSPTIKSLIKNYGKNSFTYKICKTFNKGTLTERVEASIIWEQKVLRRLLSNPSWINRCNLSSLKTWDQRRQWGKKRLAEERLRVGEDEFKKLQYERSLLAGQEALLRSKDWWDSFHKKGAQASHLKRKQLRKLTGKDPYLTSAGRKRMGDACRTTFKNTIELWNPDATVTNKSQAGYKKGDCTRVKLESERCKTLILQGWLTIEQHMLKFGKNSTKTYKRLSHDEKQARREAGYKKMCKITKEQIDIIVSLRNQGYKFSEISKIVNLADWYCARWFKKSNCS